MKRIKKLARPIMILALVGFILTAWACVQGPRINEAPLPEGWPDLTPVGEIQVKQYPTYRAAVIRDETDNTPNGMFRPLFNHIKRQDIAMTAPVEMTYDGKQQASMAFLYRSTEQGSVGSDNEDGRVAVKDFTPQTTLSIGVRGDYTSERYNAALAKLNAWLDENKEQWRAVGEPRFLGYNSPFVPAPLRYGEVQVPIGPADAGQ